MWPGLYFKRITLSLCAEDGSEENKTEIKNELEGCYTNLSKRWGGGQKEGNGSKNRDKWTDLRHNQQVNHIKDIWLIGLYNCFSYCQVCP